MQFASQTVEFRSPAGQPVKLHLVSTGAVSVKTKFRETGYRGLLAMIRFILDRKFTEWLPIWVMVIEHPEGVFVIDTGENANVNDPGYFRASGIFANWFDTTQFKFRVDREEEIDRQLQSLGIPIGKIKAVILTHLHLDHADGLRHFPQTPVCVNKAEWKRPFGDLPELYPAWFQPTLLELNDHFDEFDHAYYVTRARDIVLVQTPGHTWHHCSLIIQTMDYYICFGADVCYSQEQLTSNNYSGTNASHRLAAQTYSKLRSFCSRNPTIFVPSHEPAAARRLVRHQFLTTSNR